MIQESGNKSFWLRFSLFNLVLVALFGALMRYKIGFEFPWFQQKYLLHAHSHFAFAGWITHSLMTLMAVFVTNRRDAELKKRYRPIIIANLVCAFGMLFSFTIQGYEAVSITFSTLSILITWIFSWYFLCDLRKHHNHHPAAPWFRAALLFNFISAAGTFYLAWMMKTGQFNLDAYLGSVYYYLHFQYNGWFFFACMGLLYALVHRWDPEFRFNRNIFRLFLVTCIPAYLLSVLWLKFPDWVFVLIAGAAILQAVALVQFIAGIKKLLPLWRKNTDTLVRYFFLFVLLCLVVKIGLQLFSTIPAVSKLAFGFRPIVIAYLHLVLLAIMSMFLLTYFYVTRRIYTGRLMRMGMIVFLAGVFLNEFVLLLQGVGSFIFIVVPGINQMLFVVSMILLTGSVMMLLSQRVKG